MIVCFIGFMGSGKTTVGKLLATELGIDFIDMDAFIEERAKREIRDIFKEEGEDVFRRLETEALKDILLFPTSFVLSTGGGVITRDENIALLKRLKHRIFLKADKAVILKRLEADRTRPLLLGEDKEERIGRLLEERLPKYLEASSYTLDTEGYRVEEIVELCKAYLKSS